MLKLYMFLGCYLPIQVPVTSMMYQVATLIQVTKSMVEQIDLHDFRLYYAKISCFIEHSLNAIYVEHPVL